MFKSIFSRILSTFAVIILACILLLVFIVATELFRVNQENELAEMDVAANEVREILQDVQRRVEGTTPEVLERPAIVTVMEVISKNSNADISVLRMDGEIVFTVSGTWNPGDRMMTQDTLLSILEDSEPYAVSDLGGNLSVERFNGFALANNPDGDFLIVSTARSEPNNEQASSVTMLMAAVAVWIFFVAMVCVFFVSRRITDPIKQISDAAKEYAQGRFSTRVKVEGQDEITELSRAFNNMATNLAAHDEIRNTFIANVSHDLRTPMTTISGFVDGILDGTIPQDQQKRYLQTISGEVHRLSRMVDSMLEVGRLQSGVSLHMSEFNLTEKARQILLSLIGKIQAKNINVDFEAGEEDRFVLADPDSIHQVLYNLFENAVKFTEEGGHIHVWIGAVHGKKAQVRIHNTGECIPQDEITHVFERFYKSDRSRGLDKTGTGLGLYIVKTILDMHGEPITVESSPEEGTTFTFTLSQAGGRQRLKNPDVSDGGNGIN